MGVVRGEGGQGWRDWLHRYTHAARRLTGQSPWELSVRVSAEGFSRTHPPPQPAHAPPVGEDRDGRLGVASRCSVRRPDRVTPIIGPCRAQRNRLRYRARAPFHPSDSVPFSVRRRLSAPFARARGTPSEKWPREERVIVAVSQRHVFLSSRVSLDRGVRVLGTSRRCSRNGNRRGW